MHVVGITPNWSQEFFAEHGEDIMVGFINGGGHGAFGKEGTQAEAVDIDGHPLFENGTASAVPTVMFNEGQGDEEEADDPDAAIPTSGTAAAKKISKRTTGYTNAKDKCLCRSWLASSVNAIVGAEQKGNAYWKRVTADFHERRHLKPFVIHSDRGQVSIQK